MKPGRTASWGKLLLAHRRTVLICLVDKMENLVILWNLSRSMLECLKRLESLSSPYQLKVVHYWTEVLMSSQQPFLSVPHPSSRIPLRSDLQWENKTFLLHSIPQHNHLKLWKITYTKTTTFPNTLGHRTENDSHFTETITSIRGVLYSVVSYPSLHYVVLYVVSSRAAPITTPDLWETRKSSNSHG